MANGDKKDRSRATDEEKDQETKIGARLRFFRLAKGLSQTALGDSVGLTFQQVQKYEKGMNRISVSRLLQFSEILDFDIREFFDGIADQKSDNASKAGEISGLISSKTTICLVKDFSKIKDTALKRNIAELVCSIRMDHQ